MTATANDDFTPANSMVMFAKGSDAELFSIVLREDTAVEDIEYFQVGIATVGGTNAASGSVDADLNTAKVFIMDKSCEKNKPTWKLF